MSLTFDDLAAADLVRCDVSFGGLDKWSPTDWGCALAGEVGELCNFLKKLLRLQTNPDWSPKDVNLDLLGSIAGELADVVIYADLLAQRLGIDLGKAVVAKFNEVSERVGSKVRLEGK
jgi:NTP pyrophosphatase (non-canonical NTP hydrolase)